jgi:hypothetical protein
MYPPPQSTSSSGGSSSVPYYSSYGSSSASSYYYNNSSYGGSSGGGIGSPPPSASAGSGSGAGGGSSWNRFGDLSARMNSIRDRVDKNARTRQLLARGATGSPVKGVSGSVASGSASGLALLSPGQTRSSVSGVRGVGPSGGSGRLGQSSAAAGAASASGGDGSAVGKRSDGKGDAVATVDNSSEMDLVEDSDRMDIEVVKKELTGASCRQIYFPCVVLWVLLFSCWADEEVLGVVSDSKQFLSYRTLCHLINLDLFPGSKRAVTDISTLFKKPQPTTPAGANVPPAGAAPVGLANPATMPPSANAGPVSLTAAALAAHNNAAGGGSSSAGMQTPGTGKKNVVTLPTISAMGSVNMNMMHPQH